MAAVQNVHGTLGLRADGRFCVNGVNGRVEVEGGEGEVHFDALFPGSEVRERKRDREIERERDRERQR